MSPFQVTIPDVKIILILLYNLSFYVLTMAVISNTRPGTVILTGDCLY